MEVGDRRIDVIELQEIAEILGVDLIAFIKKLTRNINAHELGDKPSKRRSPLRET